MSFKVKFEIFDDEVIDMLDEYVAAMNEHDKDVHGGSGDCWNRNSAAHVLFIRGLKERIKDIREGD